MQVDTDLPIIGGGSAGSLAAIAARAQVPTVTVTILEKEGDFSQSALYCTRYGWANFTKNDAFS